MRQIHLNYHIYTGYQNFKKKNNLQRYTAGSSKCSTKPHQNIDRAVKEWLEQMHCQTTYARSGANQMCILNNSKELLLNLKSQNLSHIIYDLSALYIRTFRTIN